MDPCAQWQADEGPDRITTETGVANQAACTAMHEAKNTESMNQETRIRCVDANSCVRTYGIRTGSTNRSAEFHAGSEEAFWESYANHDVGYDAGMFGPESSGAKVLDSPIKNGNVSSDFGSKRNCSPCSKTHGGTDYSVPVGTKVVATAPGTVVKAYDSSSYGLTVIINHGPAVSGQGNVYTLYAHGSALSVSVNQVVSTGDIVLESGNTGNSTGPHLHYEVIQTESTPFQGSFYGNLSERHSASSLADLL